MMDSWKLRKLEPGFDATYSMFSAFSTSTMKSEPGRVTMLRLAVGWGVVTRAGTAGVPLAAAAPFRKDRRCTPPFAVCEAIVPSSYAAQGPATEPDTLAVMLLPPA